MVHINLLAIFVLANQSHPIMKLKSICLVAALLSVVSLAAQADKSFTRLALMGDIMMGTTYPEDSKNAYLPANDGRDIFKYVKPLVADADVVAANLEGVLLDGVGNPKKCKNPNTCYIFKTPTSYASNLTDLGVDVMSIANNHANDFGAAGVESTIRTLSHHHIFHAGNADRCAKTIFRRGSKTIGFIAFAHSVGTLSIMNLELVRQMVSELKGQCDLTIVSFHGGAEGAKYTHVPHAMEMFLEEKRGDVEKFAHTAIDAGADIVFGHGPHVPRAAELYRDHIIFYSLGNFATPYRVNLAGVSGQAPLVIVDLDQNGHFVSGQIHSFIQQRGVGPIPDKNDSAAKTIRSLSLSDFPASKLKISLSGALSR